MTSEQFFGLIPAAGAGERMGLATPKQYLELLGRPMLYHSVKALLADARIATVFVVLAPADKEFKRHSWGEFGERVAPLYCGGATRHDSVLNGLVAASSTLEPEDWVLVHDAARPCLAQRELQRLLDALAADEVGGYLAYRSPTRSSAPTPPAAFRRPKRASSCGRRRRRRCFATACCSRRWAGRPS